MTRHFTSKQWDEYLKDRIPPAAVLEMEAHIYECDVCLKIYSDCIDRQLLQPQAYRPEQPSTSQLTLRVSAYRRTLRNYMIASAATLVLLATGAFHGLITLSKATETHKETSSLSGKLLEDTVAFIDTLKLKEDFR